jgi:hypothetical protein
VHPLMCRHNQFDLRRKQEPSEAMDMRQIILLRIIGTEIGIEHWIDKPIQMQEE